jgi:hypothetical protein
MTSRQSVPDHLQSTYAMIRAAFPDPTRLRGMHYHALLQILMEHMSHRNIVDVMRLIVDTHAFVSLNDVYATSQMTIPDAVCTEVMDALSLHGYDAWAAEDET